MDAGRLLTTFGSFWSPLTFAALVALAVGLIWLALAPASPRPRGEGAARRLSRTRTTRSARRAQGRCSARVVGPLLARLIRSSAGCAPAQRRKRHGRIAAGRRAASGWVASISTGCASWFGGAAVVALAVPDPAVWPDARIDLLGGGRPRVSCCRASGCGSPEAGASAGSCGRSPMRWTC